MRALALRFWPVWLALIAWPLSGAATAYFTARDGNDAPHPPTAATQFEAVFQRVVGPQSLDASSADYERDLQRLRQLLPAGDSARDVRFRSVYCGSLTFKDPRQGLAYSDQVLAMTRQAGDKVSTARALLCRSDYNTLIDGEQRGLIDLDQAIALLASIDEPQLYGESLQMRGDVRSVLGEQAQAMLDFQRARAAYRDSGIDHEVDALLQSMAVAYRRMGEDQQALVYFTQSLQRMQARQDWEGVAVDLIQLGFLHEAADAPEQARVTFQQALEVAQAHHDASDANAARMGLAEALIALGRATDAQAALRDARAGFIADHDNSSDDMLLLLEGKALALQNQHAPALLRYRQAQPLMEADGNQRYLALLHEARAASEEALHDTTAALADYKQYVALELELQHKMRLQQGRLLQYEYEIRRRDFENRQLREQRKTQALQVASLQRVRRWQSLALISGLALVALLSLLAWRQWRRGRRLRTLVLVDPLTGVATRAALESGARQALAADARAGRPLSLLMLDLDYFKVINDRFGHAAGDRVLADSAQACQALLRDQDMIGRFGGEEFVIVCPRTALEPARQIANRLIEAIAAQRFDAIAPELRPSASVGVAQAQDGETLEALMARADAALYRAKQNGRNRVEV